MISGGPQPVQEGLPAWARAYSSADRAKLIVISRIGEAMPALGLLCSGGSRQTSPAGTHHWDGTGRWKAYFLLV